MIISVFNEPLREISGKSSPLGHPIAIVELVLSVFPFLRIGFWLRCFGGGWNARLSQAPEQFGVEPCAAFLVRDLSNESAVPVG